MGTENQSGIATAFDELCDLVDRINWMRAPYRGLMAELAAREGVGVSAISNAIHRDRNERIMLSLLELAKSKELKMRAAVVGVCGDLDATGGG